MVNEDDKRDTDGTRCQRNVEKVPVEADDQFGHAEAIVWGNNARRPIDPSSATRPTREYARNSSGMAGTRRGVVSHWDCNSVIGAARCIVESHPLSCGHRSHPLCRTPVLSVQSVYRRENRVGMACGIRKPAIIRVAGMRAARCDPHARPDAQEVTRGVNSRNSERDDEQCAQHDASTAKMGQTEFVLV